MNGRSLHSVACVAVICLSAPGCAGDGEALRTAEASARQHADYVVREARAEVSALRSELASARLAAARQEAELQDLRQRLATLQQTRAEQARVRETREGESAALRNERDQLLKAAAEARTVQASVQARLTDLEAEVASLTAELAEFKLRRGQKPSVTPGRSARPAPGGSDGITRSAIVTADLGADRLPVEVSGERDSQAVSGARPDSIRVQAGDSLWRIARRYRTTVADLKDINELTGDLILIGQLLIIPPEP